MKHQKGYTLSGLHPDILLNSKRGNMSPILACSLSVSTGRTGSRFDWDIRTIPADSLISCWVALPGCDFEVLIDKNIAIAFRRADVIAILEGHVDTTVGSVRESHLAQEPFGMNYKLLERAEFNAELLDNMMIALRGVAGKGDVVATSRHFTNVMAKAIEKLEDISTRAKKKGDEDLAGEINTVKLEIFRHLMSQDLRK